MGHEMVNALMGAVIALGVMAGAAAANPAGAPLVSAAQQKKMECEAMEREERWGELKRCADQLKKVRGATREEVMVAASLRDKATLEQRAKDQYDRFLKAQLVSDLRKMEQLAKGINSASRYAEPARVKLEAERSRYVDAKIQLAMKAGREGRCREMKEASAAARAADPSSAKVLAVVKCFDSRTCETPEKKLQSELLYEEIQTARINDQQETLRLASLALEEPCFPELPRRVVVRVAVIAACSLKQPQQVQRFYAEGKNDTALIHACPEYLKP